MSKLTEMVFFHLLTLIRIFNSSFNDKVTHSKYFHHQILLLHCGAKKLHHFVFCNNFVQLFTVEKLLAHIFIYTSIN